MVGMLRQRKLGECSATILLELRLFLSSLFFRPSTSAWLRGFRQENHTSAPTPLSLRLIIGIIMNRAQTPLKTQLRISFTGSAVVAMLVAIAVTFLNTRASFSGAVTASGQALDSQLIAAMENFVIGASKVIEAKFVAADRLVASVVRLFLAAELSGDPLVPRVYPNNSTKAVFDDTLLASETLNDAVSWYRAGLNSSNYSSWLLTASDADEIVGVAPNLGPLIQDLADNVEGLSFVYVGFEEEGIYMQYPGERNPTRDLGQDYDPRVRPWYTAAAAEAGGSPVVTAPYYDAGQVSGWLVSSAVSHDDSSGGVADGSPGFVVGADFTLTALNEIVGGAQFLNTGTATLFDAETPFGTVLSHPDWNPNSGDPGSLIGLEQELWDDEAARLEIFSGSSGILRPGNGSLVFAYARVEPHHVLYAKVSADEVSEPARVMEEKAGSTQTLALIVTLGTALIVAFVVTLLVSKFVDKLGVRLSALQKMSGSVVKMIAENKPTLDDGGNDDAKLLEGARGNDDGDDDDDELHSLFLSLTKMVTSLREKESNSKRNPETPSAPVAADLPVPNSWYVEADAASFQDRLSKVLNGSEAPPAPPPPSS